jgi:hypothetical protein
MLLIHLSPPLQQFDSLSSAAHPVPRTRSIVCCPNSPSTTRHPDRERQGQDRKRKQKLGARRRMKKIWVEEELGVTLLSFQYSVASGSHHLGVHFAHIEHERAARGGKDVLALL